MLDTQASRHASLFAMVQLSLGRLSRAIRKAYRGLALAPKRLPLDANLLCTLLGAPDEATACDWRDTLASYSLLQLAQDGACTAHDLQLDYLRKDGPPPEATGRLHGWLIAGEVFDSLNGQELGSPFWLSVMALWREVERVRGEPVAAAACVAASSLRGDDKRAAVRLSSAAQLLRRMDSFAEAVALFERALTIEEAAYGPHHTKVATTLHGMAGVLQTQGKLTEAMALYERALTIDEAAYGPDHTEVAATLHSMASVLQTQGKLTEAMTLYERAQTIKEAAYGPDHTEVAATLHNMASVLRKQGKTSEALPLATRALGILTSAFGAEHHHAKICERLLARLRKDSEGEFCLV